MISKKSLNVLFGILVSLMIIFGIHIIVMIFKQEIVTSFYVFAGITILCAVVYIIAFLQMRYLIKNPQNSKSIICIDEQQDDKISKEKLNYHNFIDEMIEFTKELTSTVLSSSSKYHHDNATTHKCPQCGKLLLDVTNNFGKSLVSSRFLN